MWIVPDRDSNPEKRQHAPHTHLHTHTRARAHTHTDPYMYLNGHAPHSNNIYVWTIAKRNGLRRRMSRRKRSMRMKWTRKSKRGEGQEIAVAEETEAGRGRCGERRGRGGTRGGGG